MDEKLEKIFSNINDWLRFAEAKSATLIAGNGALIFAIFRLRHSAEVPEFLVLHFNVSIFFCLMSMVVCLISITPSLGMPWESKPRGCDKSDNLLFFEDISKYTPASYLNKIGKNINLESSDFTGYQKDLASQIIVNSVIARKKYNFFKIAVWLSLFALVSPVVGIALYLIGRR